MFPWFSRLGVALRVPLKSWTSWTHIWHCRDIISSWLEGVLLLRCHSLKRRLGKIQKSKHREVAAPKEGRKRKRLKKRLLRSKISFRLTQISNTTIMRDRRVGDLLLLTIMMESRLPMRITHSQFKLHTDRHILIKKWWCHKRKEITFGSSQISMRSLHLPSRTSIPIKITIMLQ